MSSFLVCLTDDIDTPFLPSVRKRRRFGFSGIFFFFFFFFCFFFFLFLCVFLFFFFFFFLFFLECFSSSPPKKILPLILDALSSVRDPFFPLF